MSRLSDFSGCNYFFVRHLYRISYPEWEIRLDEGGNVVGNVLYCRSQLCNLSGSRSKGLMGTVQALRRKRQLTKGDGVAYVSGFKSHHGVGL
jgi:hypothetical protein